MSRAVTEIRCYVLEQAKYILALLIERQKERARPHMRLPHWPDGTHAGVFLMLTADNSTKLNIEP